MLLTKEEAICIVLKLSDNYLSSKTKLNKIIARLNLFMIPVDIDFRLNKFGSFSSDLEIEDTKYYKQKKYNWKGENQIGVELTKIGDDLANIAIEHKLKKILTTQDMNKLAGVINTLSKSSAQEISKEEHRDLLVDVEDRFKLIQRINVTHTDMFDLYENIAKLNENNPLELRLGALIEYCYFLTRYLKEKRFKTIEKAGYDYDANMVDYYFLYVLQKDTIPFIKKEMQSTEKDPIKINRHYQYFINFASQKYPFSLENQNLKELII